MSNFRLVVTQEDGLMLGRVAGLPGATYGVNLADLLSQAKDLIILSANLDENAEPEIEVIAGD